MAKAKQFSERFLSFFLVLLLFFGNFVGIAPMSTVYAHKAAVVSVLINDVGGGYVVASKYEDSPSQDRSNHIEWSTWGGLSKFKDEDVNALYNSNTWQEVYGGSAEEIFSKLIIPTKNNGELANAEDFGSTTGTEKDSADGMMFAWPANDSSKRFFSGIAQLFGGSKADATSDDLSRASEIAQTLGASLNQLINIGSGAYALNDSGFQDVIQSTIAASIYITPGYSPASTSPDSSGFQIIKGIGTEGKYTLYYGTDKTKTIDSVSASDMSDGTISSNLSWLPQADNDGNLLVYIDKKDESGNEVKYTKEELMKIGIIWAMPKRANGEVVSGDVTYLSVHQMAAYSNFLYAISGISSSYAGSTQKLGVLEEAIFNLFSLIINGVIELLGLYTMDELIFNEGVRGTAAFNSGLMSTEWWNVVMKYFTIFQVLAWIFLTLALAKQLAMLNVKSFANSRDRSNFMELLVKFFAVGGCLLLCVPIARFMLDVNNALVQVFASAYAGDMSVSPQTPNAFAQLFMSLAFFMITFYTNFIYIMRSITLAILIAMGPFFIVMMAFSNKNDMFTKWLKEVCANIFLQAFHAFAFSFLFEAIVSGGGFIERLVVIFAVMPLTDFFRGMVFGDAGSFAVSTGKQLGSTASTALKGIAKAGAGMAAGGITSGIYKHLGDDASAAAASQAAVSAGMAGGAGSLNPINRNLATGASNGGVGEGHSSGAGGGSGAHGGPNSVGRLSGAVSTLTHTRKLNENGDPIGGFKGVLGQAGGVFGDAASAAMGALSVGANMIGGAADMLEGTATGDGTKTRMGAEAFGAATGVTLTGGPAAVAGKAAAVAKGVGRGVIGGVAGGYEAAKDGAGILGTAGGAFGGATQAASSGLPVSKKTKKPAFRTMAGPSGQAYTVFRKDQGDVVYGADGKMAMQLKPNSEAAIKIKEELGAMTFEDDAAFNKYCASRNLSVAGAQVDEETHKVQFDADKTNILINNMTRSSNGSFVTQSGVDITNVGIAKRGGGRSLNGRPYA